MRISALALFALILLPNSAHAQDIFKPLQDFVEEVLPPRGNQSPPPRRTTPAPRPVPPAAPTPAEERPAEGEDAGQTTQAPNDAPDALPPSPRPRPDSAPAPVQAEPPVAPPEPAAAEPQSAPAAAPQTPAPRATAQPERAYQTACPALISGLVVGNMVPTIADGICGERSPLEVTAVRVSGREIPLTSPVTTNCAMATAFADWVGEVDQYAKATSNTGIASVTTGTSMMCRNRVGGSNGFVSEHGFANALDVTGVTLEDGQKIDVKADWLPATTPAAKLLRQAHGAACGRFTTVLGPEANAEHEDHFHFDLGCHGQSCTAQICE